MPLGTRKFINTLVFACLPLLLSASLTEFGSAQQGGQGQGVWDVKLAANKKAGSNITLRNQCRDRHTFTLIPQNTPFLRLPTPPTATVNGQSILNVPVTFDTAGMQPGEYTGSVLVRCDTCREERDCRQENEVLQIRLTVLPEETRPTPTPAGARPQTTPVILPTPGGPAVIDENTNAACKNDRCKVNEVILNTGYDHAAGATYSPVVPDGHWELVDAPNEDSATDPDDLPDSPGTSTTLFLPSPAWVINKNPAWATLTGSEWISAYKTSARDTNNPPPAGAGAQFYAPYAFQRCFCTCEGVRGIALKMRVLVDNTAVITFDGMPIDSLAQDITDNFTKGLEIERSIEVRPGKHCLRIDVRNLSKVAMGLNVNGTATSIPSGKPLFLSAACCSPAGKIIGRKFDDRNCNGRDDNSAVNQSIEPGLQGWIITLTNTATGATTTATTDADGFYYFNNLPPGTYTVSETLQAGWSQTIPGAGGTHTVTLKANEVVQKDFGNCRKAQGECAQVVTREVACKADGAGGYVYTFSLTNNSGRDVNQILLTPRAGSTFTLSQQVFNLSTPLPSGQSTTLSVNIGNVKPGEPVCFLATLMSEDGPCCTVEVCPVLPDCCARIVRESLVPAPGPPGTFDYTFTIANQTPSLVEHIYLTPPAGVTVTPDYLPVSIPANGGTLTRTVRITGATPGATLCFRISLHTRGMQQCCSLEQCIKIPGAALPGPRAPAQVRNR
jgi:hypothetical protein